MTPKPKGIAARAGHWSARHRKTAIFGWLGLIIALFMIGGSVGQKQPTDAQKLDGDSRKAMQIYEDAGFEKKTSEMVLVQSKTKTVDDPAFQAAIADVAKTVSKQSVVANVTSDAVSEDRRSALVQFDIKGDPETATERIQPVMDATKSVATRHSGLAIEQYGDASLTKSMDDQSKAEEGNSQFMSFGMTLLILALTFGALVAASVPVLLALTAVIGTSGVMALASQILPLDNIAMPAIILIGLAVGVDYSLFYIRREREERAKGRGKLEAIDIAAATSGRAVLISGLTVMAAMAGMLLTGNTIFVSMGIATMLVIAVAVIGSLTVLPAVLAAHGRQAREGPPAVHRPPSVPGPRVPHVGLADRPRHAAPDRRHRRRRRRARRAVDPGARHADQAARHRVLQQASTRASRRT